MTSLHQARRKPPPIEQEGVSGSHDRPGGRTGWQRSKAAIRTGRSSWIQYAIAIALAVFVLGPLVPVLYQSVVSKPLYEGLTLGLDPINFVNLFTKAGFGQVILNSLLFAGLTMVGAVGLGLFFAICVVRVRIVGVRAAGVLVLSPMFVATLVLSFGWVYAYGPQGWVSSTVRMLFGDVPWNLYSIPGMALVGIAAFTPLAYLYCSGALKLADPSMEDAARVCGLGPIMILRRITVPLLRPAILYSSVLIFTSALGLLSIPLILGNPSRIEMFATFLYRYGISQTTPDYGILAAGTVVLIAFMGGLLIIQMRFLRAGQRFVSLRGKATSLHPLDAPSLRVVGSLVIWAYITIAAIIPLSAVVVRSLTSVLSPYVPLIDAFTFDHFVAVLTSPQYYNAITNSIQIALVGSVSLTIFAALVMLVSQRSNFKFRGALFGLSMIPQAIPSLVIGLGFFWFFVILGPLNVVSGTIFAIVIAFACHGLPVASGAIAPVLSQIGRELDESARTLGADWWHTVTRLIPRLILPGLLSSFVLVFIMMIKEFEAALFLVTGETQIIGTASLLLWDNGSTGIVAALSVVQIFITLVFVIIASRLFKVKFDA